MVRLTYYRCRRPNTAVMLDSSLLLGGNFLHVVGLAKKDTCLISSGHVVASSDQIRTSFLKFLIVNLYLLLVWFFEVFRFVHAYQSVCVCLQSLVCGWSFLPLFIYHLPSFVNSYEEDVQFVNYFSYKGRIIAIFPSIILKLT